MKGVKMAAILVPGVDPDADRLFRKAHGLGPNDPAPVGFESPTFPEDEARNREFPAMPRQQPTRFAQTPSMAQPAGQSFDKPMTNIEAARRVLDKAALGSDIATIALAAGGVTAPIAPAAKLLNYASEAGLAGVNAYDGFANSNWGPLEAQAASFPVHFFSGGRVLQQELRATRDATGLLRDGAGRFRNSVLNNDAIKEAGDAIKNHIAAATADGVFNR